VLDTSRLHYSDDDDNYPQMVERVPLTEQDVAYLVGRSGQTRIRLENFSNARLNIDRDCAEVEGSPEERELATLAIKITLQQRNGGSVEVDFMGLEDREDVSTFDVPQETVGFLLGAKGATLRQMESKHRTFMFFDNDRIRQGKHGSCKRLYVIGSRASREGALDEAEDVVRYKLTGESRRPGPPGGGGGRGPPPRGRSPPRYDDRRSPPRYDDRRSPPPRYDDRRSPPPRYEDRRSPPRYDERERDRYEDRRGGGYDDRRGGGYDDRRGGGYDDRRGGGYDDRRGGGGYDDRRGGGGYDDRRGGGYDERRVGGYEDRGRSPPRGRSRSPPPPRRY